MTLKCIVRHNEFLSRCNLSGKRCISHLFQLFVQHKHITLAPPYMQPNANLSRKNRAGRLGPRKSWYVMLRATIGKYVNNLRWSFQYLIISWQHARWKLMCAHLPLLYAPAVTLHSICMIFTLMIFIGTSDLCHYRGSSMQFDENPSSESTLRDFVKFIR